MTARKRLGSFRRLLGVLTAALGVLLISATIASAWWWVGYCRTTWLADFGDGTLYINTFTSNQWDRPLEGWFVDRNTSLRADQTERSWSWTWWTWGHRAIPGSNQRSYSVWPAGPAITLIGALLYSPGRAVRRRRRGQCIACGYSLAGLREGAACPECGAQVGAANKEAGEATPSSTAPPSPS